MLRFRRPSPRKCIHNNDERIHIIFMNVIHVQSMLHMFQPRFLRQSIAGKTLIDLYTDKERRYEVYPDIQRNLLIFTLVDRWAAKPLFTGNRPVSLAVKRSVQQLGEVWPCSSILTREHNGFFSTPCASQSTILALEISRSY
jgi:hypothetical protein